MTLERRVLHIGSSQYTATAVAIATAPTPSDTPSKSWWYCATHSLNADAFRVYWT
ncbi:hypothetical protein ACFVRU_53435 [Streptomyces sp. NPDC057927]